MQPVADQIIVFLMLVLLGGFIGLIFDVYRVLRRIYGLKKRGTNFGDAIFWITATSITYIFLLTYLWGEVRVYVFISMIIGFILYIRIFSKNMCKRILRSHQIIQNVITFIVKTLILPIKRIVFIILIPARFTIRRLRPPNPPPE